MNDSFASANAKLARGEEHRAELDRELAKFRKRPPYRISIKDDTSARESIHEIRYTQSVPVEWQPIIGDCLHNYRCALDHVVWTLVSTYGACTDQRQFPIACSRMGFDRAWPNCVGNISRQGVKAAFESLQPYKRANLPAAGPARHPLWLLHRLDIVDKHRQMPGARLQPSFLLNTPIPGFRWINQSADLISFAVPFDAHGPVHVQPQVPVNIVIAEVDLGRVLRSTGSYALGTAFDLTLDATISEIETATRVVIKRLARYCN